MSLTDLRIQFIFATVQLQPSEITEADLRAPADQFAKLSHANERCREGKLFVHKAEAMVEHRDGKQEKGLMQSALFDTDKSNGKAELKELMDAVKQTIVERMFPEDEPKIITNTGRATGR